MYFFISFQNRARQLYTAGYKTIEDIAKCRPMQLVKSIEHMHLRIAKEIISAAKVDKSNNITMNLSILMYFFILYLFSIQIILMKKLDHLEEETEALKVCLKPNDDNLSEQL